MQDDALMQRAQEGDAAAFEALLARHERPIFNFLRRLGMNTAESAEGTQDVFLKLWERRAQYRPGGGFQPYLYRIARNYRINRLRRGPLDAARFLESRSRASEAPDEPMAQEETRLEVRKALAELPEELQQSVVLKCLQKLSYAEVAEATGLSVRQAEDRVAEGLRLLASRLSPPARAPRSSP